MDFLSMLSDLGKWAGEFFTKDEKILSYIGDATAGVLTGAAVGAIAAAVTGGNVLKGTLVGGGLGLAGGLVASSTREKSSGSDATANQTRQEIPETPSIPSAIPGGGGLYPGMKDIDPTATGLNTSLPSSPLMASGNGQTPSGGSNKTQTGQSNGLIGSTGLTSPGALATIGGAVISGVAGNMNQKDASKSADRLLDKKAQIDLAYLREQQAFAEKQQNQAIALKRVTPVTVAPMNWRINLPTLAEGMAISKAQNRPAALPA